LIESNRVVDALAKHRQRHSTQQPIPRLLPRILLLSGRSRLAYTSSLLAQGRVDGDILSRGRIDVALR
jgi:hypothetical protein